MKRHPLLPGRSWGDAIERFAFCLFPMDSPSAPKIAMGSLSLWNMRLPILLQTL